MTGIMVPSGKNEKLRCFSTLKFDASILMKKDGVHTIQNQISTSEGGGHQAVFLLNHVSSTQTGTYRCYGVFGHYPYVWSHPSDRLQLWVTAPFAEASDHPVPTSPRPSPEPAAWHLSAENQVRLSMAGLILLVLGVLLAEAWYSQKMPLNGHRQAPT
nr:PREDICTED: leukocyte immunoglobulin-like receptor subfamily A member 6 isoform X2 [Equus przewalskii]XP_014586254.1 leukocyte immunoglobulin-like receptor subfamily A member 6 isoform X2 [Equus caballus]XP_023506276.1 leukocyte immunoglobulin-like receptor subfamily A member 6 isoform X2 [Equus caballus]